MKYDMLYTMFKKELSDVRMLLEKLERDSFIDETDGMHPVFGMVVVPYILQAVTEKRLEEIHKIFFFLENMAVCNDAEVVGVLQFTVLEQLIDEGPRILELCKQYMGKHTLKHCEEIEKYFM